VNHTTFADPSQALAVLARLIAPLVAPFVAEELARKGSCSVVYGSRRPYDPPPGETHRSFRDKGPELVASGFAERRGGKRGRSVVYLMTAEQHAAYAASRRAASTAAASNVIDLDARIEELVRTGRRPTRTTA
jgi:hypothetical protein